MPDNLIALIRVSTDKQGKSGLGLEAQNADIEKYQTSTGSKLLKTYLEIESGTHDDIESRPQLRAAVAHAKRAKAVLVIAKIDRLVRSTIIMAYLKTSKVRFVACDNPHASEFMDDIYVAVAAEEGRKIANRTKDALEAYKAHRHVSKRIKAIYPNGVPEDIVEATAGKLGASLPQCRNLTAEARAKGSARSAAARRAAAIAAVEDLVPSMMDMWTGGRSLKGIADRLNADGQTTPGGSTWSPMQVKRVLDRART
jgi:DNA invertase Pin-like site-specific DNA recombinase